MGIDPLAELIGESPAMAAVRQTLQRLLERQARARRPGPDPPARRDGGRQEPGGPRASPRGSRGRRALRRRQLRGDPGTAARGRAVRLRAGGVHGRQAGQARAAAGGPRRDPVPRRGRAPARRSPRPSCSRPSRRARCGAWGGRAASPSTSGSSRPPARTSRRPPAGVGSGRTSTIAWRSSPSACPPCASARRTSCLLAERFLREACAEAGLPPKTLTADARAALRGYAWPGNIRELKNVVTRAVLLTETPELPRAALQLPPGRPAVGGAARRVRQRRDDGAGGRRRGRGGPDRAGPARDGLERLARRGPARAHAKRPSLSHRQARPEPRAPVGSDERPRWRPARRARDRRAVPALPLPVTSLIGRERELREIALRLATHRVVTLTGHRRGRQDPARPDRRPPAPEPLPGRRLVRRAGQRGGRRASSRRRSRRRWASPRRRPDRPWRS